MQTQSSRQLDFDQSFGNPRSLTWRVFPIRRRKESERIKIQGVGTWPEHWGARSSQQTTQPLVELL